MRILALDPGSSCGLAVGSPAGVDASGVWQLAPGRGESPGMRYVRLRGFLQETRRGFPDLSVGGLLWPPAPDSSEIRWCNG